MLNIWYCDFLAAEQGLFHFLKSVFAFLAINTLCVDLMAGMVLVSLLVYKYSSTWYIGSIVAICISLFLFIYGVRYVSLSVLLFWKYVPQF